MSRLKKFYQKGLSDSDMERLLKITKTPTMQARMVSRATMLLLVNDHVSVKAIAEKLDVNRKAVELCIDKYLAAGMDAALNDLKRSGRPPEISDEEKAWIRSLAC